MRQVVVLFLLAVTIALMGEEVINRSVLITAKSQASFDCKSIVIALDGAPLHCNSIREANNSPTDYAFVLTGGRPPVRSYPNERNIYSEVVEQLLVPERDRAMLVFAGRDVSATGWTNNVKELQQDIRVQPIPELGSPTLAMKYAIANFKADGSRKVLILFADPEEAGDSPENNWGIFSRYQNVARTAEQAGVTVFVIDIRLNSKWNPQDVQSRQLYREQVDAGTETLKRFAATTGGSFLKPQACSAKQIVKDLRERLSQQYWVEFEWPPLVQSGKLHLSLAGQKFDGPETMWRK